VTFQEGGSFEGGRVRRRAGGARGGRGIAVGGGITGIIVLAAIVLLSGGGLGDVFSALTGDAAGTSGQGSQQQGDSVIGDCSAEQANTQRDCRLSATVQALDAYWTDTVPAGTQFALPEVVSFDGSTSTGCGTASSATGPFYCPPDQTIYLDLSFYDDMTSQLGAQDGPLAEMYVTAHEYGHHIQNLLGTMDAADRSGTGADSDSVRIELQADCYAGMWAGHAASTVDPDTGRVFLEPITDAQLANALQAAEAVGDDHIQQQSGGGVDPDSWTHGSSEQRQRWFTTGYERGTLESCDTFADTDL
jgi:predicted metalloprotease